jgi:uncharacterized protein YbjT (DUF2867 family)
MRIAITGGTGFVGGHLAHRLSAEGHEVVVVARGKDQRRPTNLAGQNVRYVHGSVADAVTLHQAFAGCEAVAHCAGINREIGSQTYGRIHVEGTRRITEAALKAGVRKIVFLSFLRARPDCGSGYHESKWAAEEIVRGSGLDYTILKAGVIYGHGDHMLDHLSKAFLTFPLFAFVGRRPRPIRPVAVEDVVHVLRAALVKSRLSRQTVPILGPEQLDLSEAVRRVAAVVGSKPLFFPAPVAFHYGLAAFCEAVMTVPLVSRAQVRILSEGIVETIGGCAELPEDLAPRTPFQAAEIRRRLPEPLPFRLADLRSCSDVSA